MSRRIAALMCLLHGAVFAQSTPNQGQVPPRDPAAQARFDALFASIQDLQKRHMVTVNGSENPGALKRGAVLEMFFGRMGPSDDIAFAQFAAERYGATGQDAEVLKQASLGATNKQPSIDICVRVLDGSLPDGLSIAKYVTAIDEESDKDTAARYQGLIDKLSPRVRANVEQLIRESAVKIGSGNLDHLGMAQEDPDLYKTMMTGLCRGKKAATAARPN
jgi:hypothetical protein